MKNLLSNCGFECKKCPIYIATINNDIDSLNKIIEKLKKETNNCDLILNDILCEGCKANGKLFYYCYECEFRNKKEKKRTI